MIDESGAGRIGGAALILAAAGTVLAMSHHPSGMHSGPLGGAVHGAMIALLLIMAWGFLQFASIRGLGRPLVSGGLLAFGVSLFAHIGAATINGFVVPSLASPEAPPVDHDVFRLLWHSNQALARLGVIMTGAAFVLWGGELLGERSRETKLLGGLGLIAGAVPILLLATGAIRMDVAGAFLTYSVHAGWTVLVGLQLLRGRLAVPTASIG